MQRLRALIRIQINIPGKSKRDVACNVSTGTIPEIVALDSSLAQRSGTDVARNVSAAPPPKKKPPRREALNRKLSI